MRKFQKEQAQNFIQLLGEAHEEIRVNIEKKNYEPVLVTLADCQDGAIALGNLIEAAEGEGCVTIPLLEKYCELVFQIHTDISSGGYVDAIKTDKSLRKALTQIENSVRDDIKVRKEIAFFPYKASMWDSLESVYLAAKEDPDCDAYCVPIPYFDKNADGSLGKMHYEGNEYPKNIEVTSYLTYSVPDRRPDVIYIHNPYDDYNRVTSVHPNFYSRNLKPYTDELIYIPYFVLTEIEPDDEMAIEASKHFFVLPAVFQADKVIVQSEKMRQVYINALTKHVGEESRPIWEQKILGLGSPKFDKVLNTKKEDLEIPEEWLKIIEKPDGSWKKVIFYNTSIGALLKYNEKMLQKMQSVFEIFKGNKDEVALLWRPHPLIQATIESMRPQLLAQYKEIVEQYKAEGWGIYDDTSDVNRAIALSDAYYGDHSSVVQLFGATKNNVMMANVVMGTNNSSNNLMIGYDIKMTENAYYIFSEWNNSLVEIAKENNNYINIYSVPKEDTTEELFLTWEIIGEKIWFAPFNAMKVYIFDLEKKKFECIELNLNEDEKGTKGKISIIIDLDSRVLMVGENIQSIYVIEKGDYSVKRIDDYVDLLINNGVKDKVEININQTDKAIVSSFLFAYESVEYANKIYLPMRLINYVLVLDKELLKFEIIQIKENNEIEGFVSVYVENNRMYLYGHKAYFVIDMVDGTRKKYEYQVKKYENERLKKVVKYQNTLVLFYHDVNEIDVISCGKYSNELLEVGYPCDYVMSRFSYTCWGGIACYDNKIYFQSRKNGTIYFLDMSSMMMVKIEVQMSEDVLRECIKERMDGIYEGITENRFISLEDWVNYLCVNT